MADEADVSTDDDPIQPTTGKNSSKSSGSNSDKNKKSENNQSSEAEESQEEGSNVDDDDDDDDEDSSKASKKRKLPTTSGKNAHQQLENRVSEHLDDSDDDEACAPKKSKEETERIVEIDRLKNMDDKAVVSEIIEEGVKVLSKSGKRAKINPYRIRYLSFIKKITTMNLDPVNGIVAEQPIKFGEMCSEYAKSSWFSLQSHDYVSTVLFYCLLLFCFYFTVSYCI